LFQRQSSTLIKRLFSHESDRSAFSQFLMQVVEVYANYTVKIALHEVLRGCGRIAPYGRKNENALSDLFRSARHCSFPA
jgi:hypothetical protein